MRNIFSNIFTILLIYSISVIDLAWAQSPYIRNYSPSEYLAYRQNWAFAQDAQGVLYVGNGDGMLAYDGHEWRLLTLPNKSVLRALAVDKTRNRIYASSSAEFGYFENTSKGEKKYVSLTPLVPKEFSNFKDVWKIYIFQHKIVYQASECIFIYDPAKHKLKILKPQGSGFHVALKVHNQLYVRDKEVGLFRLDGDSLYKVPQSEAFANERIYILLPHQNGKILMMTRTQGAFLFDPAYSSLKPHEAVFTPFPMPCDQFLRENLIYCSEELPDGNYAIGTQTGGVIIIDKKGNTIEHINHERGLLDNSVLALGLDHQKDLWIGLNSGISRYNRNLPIERYTEVVGFKGSILSANLFNNHLYLGTSVGAFYGENAKKFTFIEGTASQCFTFFQAKDRLLLGHNYGIFDVEKDKATPIMPDQNAWGFVALPQYPNHLIVVTSSKMIMLEYVNKKWVFKHFIQGLDDKFRNGYVDDEGYIWLQHFSKGFFRAKLNDKLDSVTEVKIYTTAHNLPSDVNNAVFYVDGKVVFGTRNGFYRFNYAKETFEPHQTLNTFLGNGVAVLNLEQDKKGNLYLWVANQQNGGLTEYGLILRKNEDGSYKQEKGAFDKFKQLKRDFSAETDVAILPIADSAVYYGVNENLYLYNTHKGKNFGKQPYQILIREIKADTTLLYGGYDKVNFHQIDYNQNNLHFAFSATEFEESEKILYSFMLENHDKDWSDWNSKHNKEYTNLHPGKYVFKVKAKNIYGAESNTVTYHFEIKPPWYRSVVAYILYVIGSMSIIWALVKWNVSRLQKEKEGLERLVKEHTVEIMQSYENIKLLSRIGQEIISTLDLEEVLNIVYESINRLVDASVFGIGIYNELDNTIEYRLAIEKGVRYRPYKRDMYNKNQLPVWCIENKKEVFVNDFHKEYHKYIKQFDALSTDLEDGKQSEIPISLIYIPLLTNGRVIGILSVQSFHANAYTLYHLDILRNIAVYITIALENAILYENLENKVQERTAEIEEAYQNVQLLSELGKKITATLNFDTILSQLYENINQLFDADVFGVGICDEKYQNIIYRFTESGEFQIEAYTRSMADKTQLAVWCIENRKEVFINDIDEEYNHYVKKYKSERITYTDTRRAKSMIYVPLISTKNKVVGAIIVKSFEKDSYSPYHLNILKNLAVYTTIALENADAYSQIMGHQIELRKKNEAITASINYAKRIQSAMLPLEEKIRHGFNDHFIMFRPRDIVSGDFYWFEEVEEKVFIAVVDCTGHGVPGAFMSLIGNDLLNEIVIVKRIFEPNLILSELHRGIRNALKQKETQSRDGMDISICVLDAKKKQMEYAGAMNPLYIAQNGVFRKIDADKHSIGGKQSQEDLRFQLHTLDISVPTTFYLTSDGYQDQFSETTKRKFMVKRFRELLESISDKSMSQQKQILEQTFDEWKGNSSQIDDVLIFGGRL